MRGASVLWEVLVRRFEEALERYRKRRLTAEEAGELPGMSAAFPPLAAERVTSSANIRSTTASTFRNAEVRCGSSAAVPFLATLAC